MKRIELRGIICGAAMDNGWYDSLIQKGVIMPESRFRKALANANDDVEIYINSQGGSVVAGNEIINAIKDFRAAGRKVEITIGALAASMAANIVAMSGAVKVRAHSNTRLMYHGCYAITEGGAGAHEDSRAFLQSINADVIAALQAKGAPKDCAAWFDEGRNHFMTAAEAKRMGLVDEIIDAAGLAPSKPDAASTAKMLADGLNVAALDFEQQQQNEEPKMDPKQLAAALGLAETSAPEVILAKLEENKTALADAKKNADDAQAKLTETQAKLTDAEAKLTKAGADIATAAAALKTETDAHAATKTTLATETAARQTAEANHKKVVSAALASGEPETELHGIEKTAAAIKAQKEKEKTNA